VKVLSQLIVTETFPPNIVKQRGFGKRLLPSCPSESANGNTQNRRDLQSIAGREFSDLSRSLLLLRMATHLHCQGRSGTRPGSDFDGRPISFESIPRTSVIRNCFAGESFASNHKLAVRMGATDTMSYRPPGQGY
jgi:hypothetical protein